ncbi:hypothetical protein PTSG_04305 [Salpingoeca rosetta]|uniref:Uncharacterized protein n=1 Tax=Salpingoeca rosetta (strain ATCC 50818 / BSB-021) TaxID=946362 RepID=F2U768_SALR5|nr:uncharacterized protein PTSG_04305 [Salpingoeca rosetta]EGD83700.1 hypothetical protein PTSG_04305 [Salpingoeca rosetta]|eukprot:XP_004995204.1 hypothetical protein PTSG_04305 [Salpingoeca rosetta]
MVMVGTSNHSDAAMRSSAVTAITVTITIDRIAAITRGPTPAPIRREADMAHVRRSDEEQQQLMCGCIVDELALCLLPISSCSSSSSLVANSSGCDCGCGGCDVRRCAVASHDDAAGGGEWTVAVLFPGPHDTSRAINAHTNVQEKKAQAFPMRCAPAEACSRQPPIQARRHLAVAAAGGGAAVMMAVRAPVRCAPCLGCTDEDKEGHGPDDDGGRGM